MRKLYLIIITAVLFSLSIAGTTVARPVVRINDDLSLVFDDSFKTLPTDHFNLVYGPNTVQDEKIAYILELAYYHFHSLFDDWDLKLQTSDEKLQWLIFSDRDCFNEYTVKTENQNLFWLTGYYSAKTNIVSIISPEQMSKWQVNARTNMSSDIIGCPPDAETDLAKVLHEVAHQLSFNNGLQKRKVLYPLWASEGLAMDFERSFLTEYFQSSRYTEIRAQQLVKLYRQNKLIPLDKFISMSRLEASDSAVEVYAQAWGFFNFLSERKSDALKKYFSDLYDNKPGFRNEQTICDEFGKAFGPLDQLETQWQQFLDILSARKFVKAVP